uniref:Trafficking protein particle complex 8 n=1 Tax=Gouania willdenowi TaxID=441366 RepID=A0A8C5G6M8_GOUWI
MAHSVRSVQEFVQDSFVPMVAVLCSEEAERVTAKNKLSFCELLRPFCRLTSEGHIRDPNNQVQVVKNLRIGVNSIETDPSTASMALRPGQLRLLDEVVLTCQPQEGAPTTSIKNGEYELNLNVNTPWFEVYRRKFLQSMPSSDHEFLNHYLACLLVVSSTEAVPVEQFLKLSQEQHRIQHSGEYTNPKWFIPNTLKYYVLLHDLSQGEEQRADAVYEDMKQRYGPQGCYLLKINSRTISAGVDEQIPDPWSQYLHKNNCQQQVSQLDGSPASNISNRGDRGSGGNVMSGNLENHPLQLDASISPGNLETLMTVNTELKKSNREVDPQTGGAGSHGAWLTLSDHDHIRQFIQEFTFRGLLPHIEKNIRQLNDQLVSRKGLSRSLLTATKKWFGGGKVPEKAVAEPKSSCGLLYPPEAPELQIRKMADLCFLVQHYELAYSCYHTAKKDFLSDQAMLYAAGALEMAAVSAFLQAGAPRPYPAHYMDTAIQIYRDLCKNMVLAERCALLSAEILKSQGKYSEAATLLIKMTSEDSDLRSALLLEQAAYCFINMRNPMVRKFAFHMILAGHRFSKAGQRRHALRCYCQAMQVYKDRGWSLAEDHINFTIGRQSFTLCQPENAVTAFRQILINDSRQIAAQQGAFLREYLYVYKVMSSFYILPQLPLPCIQSSATRVYFGPERRLAEGEKQAATHVSLDQEYDQDVSAIWCHLEEQLVAAANRGIVPANFRPTQCCLNKHTDNLRHPLAVVEGKLRNASLASRTARPLCLWLGCCVGIRRVWSGMAWISGGVEGCYPLCVILPAGVHTSDIIVRGRQDFNIQGPRLNVTKEDKMLVRHGPDRRLDLLITPPMPLMEVFFLQFPTALLCGEIRKAYVEFSNVSAVALSGLRVASTHPEFFTFGSEATTPMTPLSPTAAENNSSYQTVATPPQQGCVTSDVLLSAEDSAHPSAVMDIPIKGGILKPGESTQLPLWLRGLDTDGVHEINFLFYYESSEKSCRIRNRIHHHRVLRHTVFICASRSLSVQASACRSSIPRHDSEEDEDSRGTLVFVDLENINTSEGGVREFNIVQVSSSSPQWRLHKYINPKNDIDCKLGSRERAKLCFRATQCKPQQASLDSIQKYTFADLSLGNERVSETNPPFINLNSVSLSSHIRLNTYQQASDIIDIAKKCNELDLNIIVIWKAYVVEDNKQLILEGQLHVALQTIGKEASSVINKEEAQEMVLLKFKSEPPPPVIQPPAELSHLIKTNLHHPETFTHHFAQHSLCLVPVSLTLSNCSMAHVDAIIDLRHYSSSETQEVHSSFAWVGQSQYKLQLKPQEVMCLSLQACFLQAGVYNLSTPRVFAKPTEHGAMSETSQQTAGPALIIINSS